jgi:hypothetical protein
MNLQTRYLGVFLAGCVWATASVAVFRRSTEATVAADADLLSCLRTAHASFHQHQAEEVRRLLAILDGVDGEAVGAGRGKDVDAARLHCGARLLGLAAALLDLAGVTKVARP